MRESASKQAHTETPSATTSTRSTTPAPAHPLHDLQQSAGNQAVSRAIASGSMLRLPRRGVVHPVAAAMNGPDVQFRIPSFQRLKNVYTDPDLKIPESVIQDRVTRLLERMKAENKLKSKDPVADIVKKIFPKPGVMDEAEFEKAVDVTDRTRIYGTVLEAETKVKAADQPALKTAIQDAAKVVAKVESDATGMSQVFGSKAADAKTIYGATKTKLDDMAKDLDKYLFTDYNLDDPEVGLGGFARFSKQFIHLTLKVAQVKDPTDTKSTLIHEATHLADSSVKDHVYYNRPGFFGLSEDKKVANAAHYEELPLREMKASKFDGKTFKPGTAKSGKTLTREELILADAQNYTRKAWDAAVDVHLFIRRVRVAVLNGEPARFTGNKTLIMEISKLMDLTLHEQAAGKEEVLTLDVTIAESVARAVTQIDNLVGSMSAPSPKDTASKADKDVQDKLVADAVAKQGQLLKDKTRDKALMDWFEAHYQKIPKW